MSDDREFRDQMQRVGERVQELEGIADPTLRAKAKELVQLLMQLHGGALERMLEIIFQSGEAGTKLIDDLGEDPHVSSLLVLYGLHPEELQARVERTVPQLGPRLFKMGAELKQVDVKGSDVRVTVSIEGHTCGSTAQSVKAVVEDAMYEAAPDLTSLVIEGLEPPSASGFVAVDALIGVATSSVQPTRASHGEGPD